MSYAWLILGTSNILESTSVILFQTVAQQYQLPFKVTSLSVSSLNQLKAAFIVSSTRMQLSRSAIQCQPCRSINGTLLPKTSLAHLDIYQRLAKATAEFLNQYEYDKVSMYTI